jgi:hypothetical protein
MNAGILSLVTNTPLMNPRKEENTSAKRTAGTPPIAGSREEPITATRESIDPTDMSKSPFMMQKAIPMAPTAIKEVKRSVLTKLKVVLNAGERIENTTTRVINRVGRIKLSKRLASFS